MNGEFDKLVAEVTAKPMNNTDLSVAVVALMTMIEVHNATFKEVLSRISLLQEQLKLHEQMLAFLLMSHEARNKVTEMPDEPKKNPFGGMN